MLCCAVLCCAVHAECIRPAVSRRSYSHCVSHRACMAALPAVNVNGQTIHSWAGIGLGRKDARSLIEKVTNHPGASERWRKCSVLLIDEVSMLDDKLFEKLSAVGSAVRRRSSAFGGLQLVVCGDFFQLPPVGLEKWGKDFCFAAPAWRRLRMRKEELTEVIRQKGDQGFVTILNDLRVGKVTRAAERLFRDCHVSNKPVPDDGILPTQLFCTNVNVNAENRNRLAALEGMEVSFPADDTIHTPPVAALYTPAYERAIEALTQAADKTIPSDLRLKIGAQVVLTRNLDGQLVNGSRGMVVGWTSVVYDKEGDLQSLDDGGSRACIDAGKAMVHGGSVFAPVLAPHATAAEALVGDLGSILAPQVRFDCGRTITVVPYDTFVGRGQQNGALVRVQLPLKLAWALTIHKSQGMTLSRCQIQAAGAFEYGQVYVAISRCVSTDGMWFAGPVIKASAVMAHTDVKTFMGL